MYEMMDDDDDDVYYSSHDDDTSYPTKKAVLIWSTFISVSICIGLLCYMLKLYKVTIEFEDDDNARYDMRVSVSVTPSEIKLSPDKLPVIIYNNTIDYSPEVCVICLEEYTTHDKLTKLSCGHSFHNTCIVEWINNKTICPYCKKVPTL